MSQSKSQVEPRKRQDNAQSIKRLLASPGVIFWLKGHWNLRTDRDGKSRVLSPRLREAFEHLKAEGKITEQAPGYFRRGAGCQLCPFKISAQAFTCFVLLAINIGLALRGFQ